MCVDQTQEPVVFFITKDEAKECQRCPCKNIYVDCLVGQDSYGNILQERVSLNSVKNCDKDFCTCSFSDNYLQKAE